MTQRRRSAQNPNAKPRHRGTTINAERLKLALAVRGLTARSLAEKAGVSESTVSHGMIGRHLDPSTLHKLARALARIPMLKSADELLDVS